jgi:hypothetical protein
MVTAAITSKAAKGVRGARVGAGVVAGVAAAAGAGGGLRVGMVVGLREVRVVAKVVAIWAGTNKAAALVSRRVAAGRCWTSTACRW